MNCFLSTFFHTHVQSEQLFISPCCCGPVAKPTNVKSFMSCLLLSSVSYFCFSNVLKYHYSL